MGSEMCIRDRYNNSLIDLAHALKGIVYENTRKSNLVDKLITTFQIQLGFLAAAIGWSGIVFLCRGISNCVLAISG